MTGWENHLIFNRKLTSNGCFWVAPPEVSQQKPLKNGCLAKTIRLSFWGVSEQLLRGKQLNFRSVIVRINHPTIPS